MVGASLSKDGSFCVVVCADGTGCLLDLRSVAGGRSSMESPGRTSALRGRGGGRSGTGFGSFGGSDDGDMADGDDDEDNEPRVIAYMRLFPRGSSWRVVAASDRIMAPSRDGGGAATSMHAVMDALGRESPLFQGIQPVRAVQPATDTPASATG